ncbi:proteasome subunit beta type-5 [Drosophila mojavensis]|uniref:proteasome endopeptidase complex n=1 Tax=Drosophila mojavensis TaxID=7230 RepID=B4L7R5_DROMO|nr:proteasome subunit beta type-5 [Drosophila mojavensis]EDW05778.1 uncharacterized protein Dmoj_GI10892 [Drosophila mojavensis]
MALEQLCGLNKMMFMKPLVDPNLEYTNLESTRVLTMFDNPYSLPVPPFDNPKKRLAKLDKQDKDDAKVELTHGTTTLGFKYKGGIILAADSRASNGNFIASQSMRKVVQVHKKILGTIAGGAADCVYWDRVLTMECRLHELTYHRPLSVKSVARILSNIAYKLRGLGLSMGMMLAGYDFDGPRLVYVDGDGSSVEGHLFSVGSGCCFALGILDSYYKYDMEDEEAYCLAMRSIYHATYLDSYTGGLVRLYHMRENDWETVTVKDCADLREIFRPVNQNESLEEFSKFIREGFVPDPDEDPAVRNPPPPPPIVPPKPAPKKKE